MSELPVSLAEHIFGVQRVMSGISLLSSSFFTFQRDFKKMVLSSTHCVCVFSCFFICFAKRVLLARETIEVHQALVGLRIVGDEPVSSEDLTLGGLQGLLAVPAPSI